MLKLMERPTKAALCLALIAFLYMLAGCRQSQQQAKFEARPQRIVSLSPSVTEILYGIGVWSKVVAVSQFCTFPDDVQNKPRVNGWDKTNLEQVMALKPDFVIGVDAQEPFLRDKLTGLGVRSLFVKSQTLADIMGSIGDIGRATGHEQEAAELSAKTQAEIEAVRKIVAGRPLLKVLCVVDRVPGTIRDLYTATKGSYLDELITVAGGESIAPAAEHGYGKINKEAVLTINPSDHRYGARFERKIWRGPGDRLNESQEVRAVRERRSIR